MKTPQRLGNWFQRYKQLKDGTNNKKQKKLSALFGCILETVFASSDSFCLIKSHMYVVATLAGQGKVILTYVKVYWDVSHKCVGLSQKILKQGMYLGPESP